ncbi:putative dCMP deaminase [Paxillus ammoniavirescens]|nr:putative dCMP deaminase [Paxillus ammoniavirescens]
MFIAIVGTRGSGKSTVEDYLVAKGFTSVPFSPGRSLPLIFASPGHLLEHVTENWLTNFVTVDLATVPLVNHFAKRPFFMLVNALLGLRGINPFVKLNVINTFQSISELHCHLDLLDMASSERLRPQWDTYFMAWNTLADLASQRSNCMKRRVGAILVRENRIVATGYNGTPRGVTNCNEGGCAHCNRTSTIDDAECLCLHAEENALLEAGRDRVGLNAILFCNTCPCLKCTIKIIQSGVKTVVYNLSYKVDEASAKLFREAGVEIRRHVPPATPRALP